MARVVITGDAREARNVQVFEPRQSPDQDEVILEEFALAPGETRPMDLRSATAGYRLLPLRPDQDVPTRDTGDGFEPDQEGYVTETTSQELDAGKQALGAYEDVEAPPGQRPHPSATVAAPTPRQTPVKREEVPERRSEPKSTEVRGSNPAEPSPAARPMSGAANKSNTLRSAEETERSAQQTRKAAEEEPKKSK